MKTTPLKGMKDILPREQRIRDYVQGEILKTYRAAGFERISTPIMEDMENLDKSDGGDNLIQIGIERLHIGELFRACGIIDLIKYFRPLLAHDVHILGVELREVIGVGQRHDVQRIREAAHEILLTRCFLGRVVQTGINNEMF